MKKEEMTKLLEEIQGCSMHTLEEIQTFKNTYLGKKGKISLFASYMKDVPQEEKKTFGEMLNQLRTQAEKRLESAQKKRLTLVYQVFLLKEEVFIL